VWRLSGSVLCLAYGTEVRETWKILYAEKNGFGTAKKLGTKNKFFVAATKNFAAATKRFVDRAKNFVVVTKCFYLYFNK